MRACRRTKNCHLDSHSLAAPVQYASLLTIFYVRQTTTACGGRSGGRSEAVILTLRQSEDVLLTHDSQPHLPPRRARTASNHHPPLRPHIAFFTLRRVSHPRLLVWWNSLPYSRSISRPTSKANPGILPLFCELLSLS